MNLHPNGQSDFRVAPPKPQQVREDEHPLFWNPSRLGVQLGPNDFRKKLHDIDPDLEVAWDRNLERWNIWIRKPQLNHPISRGWGLLFQVKLNDGAYAPLDERTFSKLAEISARKWGNATSYFKRVEAEMEKDRLSAEKTRKDGIDDCGGEYFDYLQPKISMFGPSNGSKCANQD